MRGRFLKKAGQGFAFHGSRHASASGYHAVHARNLTNQRDRVLLAVAAGGGAADLAERFFLWRLGLGIVVTDAASVLIKSGVGGAFSFDPAALFSPAANSVISATETMIRNSSAISRSFAETVRSLMS
jgi:hypothetical protein